MPKTPLDHPESDLPAGLAQPARRALANAGIQRIEQLAQYSEDEVKQWHGIRPKALVQLKAALSAYGLTFSMKEKGP